jgi:hypothetical protein
MNIFQKLHTADAMDIEHVELKGFSRSIAELEWLLLILVILYIVVPANYISDTWLILKSCLLFAGFVLAFRYLNFYRNETRWIVEYRQN